MGLKLTKDRNGAYLRRWYATVSQQGRTTSHALKTPLRGKIPLDEFGRYSLALRGDEQFEASRAEAEAELASIIETAKTMKAEERHAPGYAEREAYRKIKGRKFAPIRLADLAEKNAERETYRITGDAQADKYNLSVKAILAAFAKWCADYSRGRKAKIDTLADIDAQTVALYFAEVSGAYSWQTFRKYAFILAAVYRHFMPPDADNPFEKVYADSYKGKKSRADKTTVRHETISPEQMRRVWDLADETGKPYLRRLAVLAACTGMRIGDCCTLTWDKVDIAHNIIRNVKTAKTGARIGVPIFDYREGEKYYHPLLGELRRELEGALAERREGSPHVIPEAASIYRRDPTRINKEGKLLFARALFGDEPEDATLADEPEKTPAQILADIDSANMAEGKRARVRTVYELFAQGLGYKAIAARVGRGKGNVSEDLATVEEVAGVRIRKGNPFMGENARQGARKLLKKTRRERGQGRRAACLYGWHSCRMFFVVTAMEAGVKPDVLRLVVGHSTVRMVLHYYNPDEVRAAQNILDQLAERRTPQKAPKTPLTALPADQSANSPLALANALQAILANPALTDEAKNAAVLALTKSAALPCPAGM